MSKINKGSMQRRLDEIKLLILSGRSFQDKLAHLYTDLRLAAQHTQTVQIYQLLSLYVSAEQHKQLYHTALLQAFISLQMYPQAQTCATILTQLYPTDPEVKKLTGGLKIRLESTLPAYTAVAQVSHYGKRQPPATAQIAHTLPPAWQAKWKQVTADKLTELGYFQKQKQLSRIDKKYRLLVQEQLDVCMLNYLLGHTRAVVVLSGALLEFLLAVYLQQTYPPHALAPTNQKPKKYLDYSLSELLQIYTQNQLLSNPILRLCRIARMKRNYIHLGKEIVEQHCLQPAHANLCLLAVMETIDALFPPNK